MWEELFSVGDKLWDISPIPITIYVDDLLEDLSKLGVGCNWDSLFSGSVCYADHLVLLAPSPSALRIMQEDFAINRSLRFNPSKTQLIRFSRSPSSSCSAWIYFCGQLLPFIDTVSHLSHLLHYDLNDTEDVISKLHDVIRKANCLLATFPRVGPFILTRLFQSYCLSLYGSGLWTLSCPTLQNIDVAFNKILCRIWSPPACRLPTLNHFPRLFPLLLIILWLRQHVGDRHLKQYFVEDHNYLCCSD